MPSVVRGGTASFFYDVLIKRLKSAEKGKVKKMRSEK